LTVVLAAVIIAVALVVSPVIGYPVLQQLRPVSPNRLLAICNWRRL
jgi:hypothetical protein